MLLLFLKVHKIFLSNKFTHQYFFHDLIELVVILKQSLKKI